MATTISLTKKENNLNKRAFVGFSWTTLFFGFFVPLFRGDWKWFIIMFIADCVTLWIANLIFIFVYNRIYTINLLEKGYEPADEYSRGILRAKGIVS
ncbi:HrgC protein [Helicobacter cetorum]|uniref:HrgC protein n=1 Tax=Helicobacter cetorum TaxID=138563 RepID=UPI0013150EE7|nr:HrgC protein [Helicobacter cetorum]